MSEPVDDHRHARRHPPVVDPRSLEHAAGQFRAAGDPERLRLLVALEQGEWCVSELADALEAAMSTVSQRLRVLRGDGLVRRRREGKHVFYALADAHVADFVANAIAHAGEHAAPSTAADTHAPPSGFAATTGGSR